MICFMSFEIEFILYSICASVFAFFTGVLVGKRKAIILRKRIKELEIESYQQRSAILEMQGRLEHCKEQVLWKS